MSLWDTQTYSPIPNGAKLLTIQLWGCADDCNCRRFRIWVYVGPGKGWGWILWEGELHSEPDSDEQKEMIDDLQLACNFYGIIPKGIEEGCIYYIEGERKL